MMSNSLGDVLKDWVGGTRSVPAHRCIRQCMLVVCRRMLRLLASIIQQTHKRRIDRYTAQERNPLLISK